jgi:hypothetical protein
MTPSPLRMREALNKVEFEVWNSFWFPLNFLWKSSFYNKFFLSRSINLPVLLEEFYIKLNRTRGIISFFRVKQTVYTLFLCSKGPSTSLFWIFSLIIDYKTLKAHLKFVLMVSMMFPEVFSAIMRLLWQIFSFKLIF